jgi:hypothetical protein
MDLNDARTPLAREGWCSYLASEGGRKVGVSILGISNGERLSLRTKRSVAVYRVRGTGKPWSLSCPGPSDFRPTAHGEVGLVGSTNRFGHGSDQSLPDLDSEDSSELHPIDDTPEVSGKELLREHPHLAFITLFDIVG